MTVLRVVLVALGLEALLLAGVAVQSVLALAGDDVVATGPAVATAVFALAFAALLVAAGRGLWLGRRWARGPVTTVQLLALLALAGPLLAGGSPVPGLLVGALAVVVLVGMFTRPVVAHTTRDDAEPPTV